MVLARTSGSGSGEDFLFWSWRGLLVLVLARTSGFGPGEDFWFWSWRGLLVLVLSDGCILRRPVSWRIKIEIVEIYGIAAESRWIPSGSIWKRQGLGALV